jgi:hypothetical protein
MGLQQNLLRSDLCFIQTLHREVSNACVKWVGVVYSCSEFYDLYCNHICHHYLSYISKDLQK